DGDEYVLNGEKIYVTSGERAELVVVWATLDKSQGRAAIKSFVVERSNPGMKLDRLEHKLGIRASDTAAFTLQDCRVPKDALLGMEAGSEAARLLTLQACWMADNKKPNSLQASMAKAKAGRVGTDVCLRCIELLGAAGIAESDLLEKWARDAKILDIFEGTQ